MPVVGVGILRRNLGLIQQDNSCLTIMSMNYLWTPHIFQLEDETIGQDLEERVTFWNTTDLLILPTKALLVRSLSDVYMRSAVVHLRLLSSPND